MALVSLPPAHVQDKSIPYGCPLSRAEFRIMRDVIKGETYQEIAARTGHGCQTIRSQVGTALHRLGVVNVTQAALVCVRRRWITLEGASTRDTDRLAVLALTPTQRTYLTMFDLHVKSKTEAGKLITRTMMDRLVGSMCGEMSPQVVLSRRTRPGRDLVSLLVADYKHRRR